MEKLKEMITLLGSAVVVGFIATKLIAKEKIKKKRGSEPPLPNHEVIALPWHPEIQQRAPEIQQRAPEIQPRIPENRRMNEYPVCRRISKERAYEEATIWARMLDLDSELFATVNDRRVCFNCHLAGHALKECRIKRGTLCGRCGTQRVIHAECPFCHPNRWRHIIREIPIWYTAYVGYRRDKHLEFIACRSN